MTDRKQPEDHKSAASRNVLLDLNGIANDDFPVQLGDHVLVLKHIKSLGRKSLKNVMSLAQSLENTDGSTDVLDTMDQIMREVTSKEDGELIGEMNMGQLEVLLPAYFEHCGMGSTGEGDGSSNS